MLSLRSPAKINLFLLILKRRSDGYHDLASLFQTIDLCDRMSFEEADQDVLTCNCPALPVDESNLVCKARHLFRRKTGINRYFSVHLQKNIPQQAGLGGGSSNAATTLWALNYLCGNPVAESELLSWGAEIGSDISFFLSSGTAYCTGKGDNIEQVPSLINRSLWIVKPSKGLSTPEVYSKLDLSKLPQGNPEEALASFLRNETPIYLNDLEKPAFELMPELAVLKKKLVDFGFSAVLMSGSGSSFFCVGDEDLTDLSDCSFYKARFINRKPNQWY